MPRITNKATAEELAKLRSELAIHQALNQQSAECVNQAYRLLISGNGQPPIVEIIRRHEHWIVKEEERRKEMVRR